MCSASQPSSRAITAGDPQRVALLAEQRVAAVPGAVGPDRALLGELHDVLGVVARPRDVGLAVGQRGADRVQAPARTSASSSSIRRSTSVPIRAITRIETMTYAESVISTPNIGFSALEVTHHERDDVHRAAAHAAGVQPAHDRPSSRAGAIQLLVGPASFSSTRADVGAVLDPGDVRRVGGAVEGVRLLGRVEPGEGAGRDEGVGELGPLLVGPGAPVDAVGRGQRGDLGDEVEDALVGRRGGRAVAEVGRVSMSAVMCGAVPLVRRGRPRWSAVRDHVGPLVGGVNVKLSRSAGVVVARLVGADVTGVRSPDILDRSRLRGLDHTDGRRGYASGLRQVGRPRATTGPIRRRTTGRLSSCSPRRGFHPAGTCARSSTDRASDYGSEG